MSDTEQKAEPTHFKPPSAVDPAQLMAAFEAEGIVEPKPAEAAKPATVSVGTNIPPAQPPAPSEDDGLPALLRRAKENSEKRASTSIQEVEQAKPYLEALKVLSPVQAQALAKAASMGDPVGALTALGFTHAQYNARLLGVKDPQPQDPKEERASAPDEVTALRQKLEALEGSIKQKEAAQTRGQLMEQMSTTLKDDPKFKLVNHFGKYQQVEAVILDYWQKNGQQLPGKDFAESVRMAAEVVEYELQQDANKWQGVLTPVSQPAAIASRAPESKPSTGTVSPRTLTNANSTAPAAARSKEPSRQEILDAIASGNDEFLNSL